jgi:DNA-binding PadR family transcriptional regulator
MFHTHRAFPGPRHTRHFRRGDLKYVILHLVKDQPRHGYDIIRALEEYSHGLYTPSPGVVYPTLQLLEEMGHIAGEQQDGKKVYSITQDGLDFLAKGEKRSNDIRRHMAKWWDFANVEEMGGVMHSYGELGHMLSKGLRGATAEKLNHIQQVITKAHQDIEDILKR